MTATMPIPTWITSDVPKVAPYALRC
jgi:hypothetical protein